MFRGDSPSLPNITWQLLKYMKLTSWILTRYSTVQLASVFCELIGHDSVSVNTSYVEPFFLKEFVAHCYSTCLCNLMWFRPLSTTATLVTITKGKSRPAPPTNAGWKLLNTRLSKRNIPRLSKSTNRLARHQWTISCCATVPKTTSSRRQFAACVRMLMMPMSTWPSTRTSFQHLVTRGNSNCVR